MCGRYTLFTPEQVVEIKNIVKEVEERLRERKTQKVRAQQGLTLDPICPTDLAPVLFPYQGRLACAAAFWGFTNSHESENRKREANGQRPLKPSPSFNARAENLESSPFWRESFHKRRCIIPATAFEEWQHEIKTKPGERKKDKGIPYMFTMPDSPVLYIAGIWQNEVDENGEKWPHYSMITTEPSNAVADVHDRMPVVLRRDELDEWVSGDYRKLLDRTGLVLNKRAV